MNEVYLWIVTAITAAVALSTVARLWTDRERLRREDLHDEDRAFAWRIVIFLVFPLMTLVDLRSTLVACQWLGGYVKDWSYGLFWYYAVPQGLPSPEVQLFVLFAGALVQIALAVCLLPALLFRPHPFLATIIGYTVSFIFGLNLIVDPLLSLFGMGGSRWQLINASTNLEQKLMLFGLFGSLGLIFVGVMRSQRTRLWFAELSRPAASEDLRDALMQWKSDPENPHYGCKVGILYERTGLRRQAKTRLKRMRDIYPRSIYTHFLEAVLSYRRRNYKTARRAFLTASDFPHIDTSLKAALLAASGCSAFAEGDMEGALNLSERALEFDDSSLVARMVKVDVFLRTDRKDQAGEEILAALRRGLDLDIEDKIPLDTDKVLIKLGKLQSAEKKTSQSMAKI
jgi:tetratricopeptide (TPR) repeat protein